MSGLPLQKEGRGQLYEGGLVSCGPICVELMRHFSQLSTQRLMQVCVGKKQTTQGLQYTLMNKNSLTAKLPDSLKNLLKADQLDAYQAQIVQIRKDHYAATRPFFFQNA